MALPCKENKNLVIPRAPPVAKSEVLGEVQEVVTKTLLSQ